MTEKVRFTQEELAIAKSADLTAVASALGYTVRRVGKYHTLKEMDSIRIYERSHWFRWSRQYVKGENGGSQIDFLMVFGNMEVKDAVFWLLDFVGYSKGVSEKQPLKHQVVLQEKKEAKPFILPERAFNNRYLYEYLQQNRCLSKEVIDFFVERGLVYESRPYHNIVFLGNDINGVTRFASMRGVFDRDGKGFKCDVVGNDKRYGFNFRNLDSKELVVFEAAIDLLSYVEIKQDFNSNLLALGMLWDAPLKTFLEENPEIEVIKFALDNDVPGRKATETLMETYFMLGYEVENVAPPMEHKDYNAWLVSQKNSSVNDNIILESALINEKVGDGRMHSKDRE